MECRLDSNNGMQPRWIRTAGKFQHTFPWRIDLQTWLSMPSISIREITSGWRCVGPGSTKIKLLMRLLPVAVQVIRQIRWIHLGRWHRLLTGTTTALCWQDSISTRGGRQIRCCTAIILDVHVVRIATATSSRSPTFRSLTVRRQCGRGLMCASDCNTPTTTSSMETLHLRTIIIRCSPISGSRFRRLANVNRAAAIMNQVFGNAGALQSGGTMVLAEMKDESAWVW